MIILRLLSYLIDFILVYLSSFYLLSMLDGYNTVASTLSMLLFFVYNSVLLNTNNRQTIGKYFAQLVVVNKIEKQMSLDLSIYIRELSKLLYLLPSFIGVIMVLITVIMYLLGKTTIHDFFAQTSITLKKENNNGK